MSKAIVRNKSVSYHISLEGIITRITIPGCQVKEGLCKEVCQFPSLPPECTTIQTYLVTHK